MENQQEIEIKEFKRMLDKSNDMQYTIRYLEIERERRKRKILLS